MEIGDSTKLKIVVSMFYMKMMNVIDSDISVHRKVNFSLYIPVNTATNTRLWK